MNKDKLINIANTISEILDYENALDYSCTEIFDIVRKVIKDIEELIEKEEGKNTVISEKKLAYYEHVAEHTYSPECQKIITQLVDEVRTLEALRNRKTEKLNELVAMVYWLASQCVSLYSDICSEVASNDYSNDPEMNVHYWLERARKESAQ